MSMCMCMMYDVCMCMLYACVCCMHACVYICMHACAWEYMHQPFAAQPPPRTLTSRCTTPILCRASNPCSTCLTIALIVSASLFSSVMVPSLDPSMMGARASGKRPILPGREGGVLFDDNETQGGGYCLIMKLSFDNAFHQLIMKQKGD